VSDTRVDETMITQAADIHLHIQDLIDDQSVQQINLAEEEDG